MRFLIALILFLTPCISFGGDLQFQFNSPSFNGNGYSAHVLGIYQLEQANKQKIKDADTIAAAQAAAKAAADPTNQFIATLNSMMYQQLAQQVTNSIFGNGSNHGVINVGANTIQWQKNLDNTVAVTITTPTGTTTVTVPTANFVQ